MCLEGAGGARDRTIVQQYSYGFGDITYLALDLELPPLSQWSARPRLLARLLQPSSGDGEFSRAGRKSQVTHLGYHDMTGQLRAALEQFPGVTLVQFSWIAGLIVIYLLLLGPVDFLLLRRIGRPQWTWFTFPVVVIAFCGLSVWLFHHWKGSQLRLNQVEIVDVDVAQQLVRGTVWANVYSPATASLQVDFHPVPGLPSPILPAPALVSWQGLPGSGLGGMNAPAASGSLLENDRAHEYRISCCFGPQLDRTAKAAAQGQIRQLPLQTASTKALVARWWGRAEVESIGQLKADDLALLTGTVTNPLSVELKHCSVYYQNWAYPLDAPLRWRVDSSRSPATAGSASRLTRRSVVGAREVRSTWRRDDVSNMDRIAEVMMFYDAAGGQVYTGLSHNYQGFVDLSRNLSNGQAILVGRCETPASKLSVTSSGPTAAEDPAVQDVRHWTYYRIVLPVQPGDAAELP